MAENSVKVTLNADSRKADDAIKRFQGNVKKAGLALSAIGAGGVLAIKGFTQAAIEQERSLNLVLTTAANAGESMDGLKERVEAATAALQQKTNFGDEDQMKALAQLIPMLGSTENALKALPAVMDVATLQGQDLISAVRTMGPALAGTTNRIRGTTLEFDKSQGPMERVNAVLKQIGGTAEAGADPFTQLGNATGDLKEKIGAALLPTVTTLLQKLLKFVEFLQTLNPAILKWGAGILGIATAIGVVGGPLLLFSGLIKGILVSFTAMAFTPIGAIITAIALAVGAGILVWKNWDTIINSIKATFNKFIRFINDNAIPAINNVIEVLNIGGFLEINTIEPLKELRIEFTETVTAMDEAADQMESDLIPSFEGVRDFIDMSVQQLAALKGGVEDLNNPMTDLDKAKKKLNEATTQLGLKEGALEDIIKEAAKAYGGDMVKAINAVVDKYVSLRNATQDAAFEGLDIFNRGLEQTKFQAAMGKEGLDSLIESMERFRKIQAIMAGGGFAPAGITTPTLTARDLMEDNPNLTLADALQRVQGFPGSAAHDLSGKEITQVIQQLTIQFANTNPDATFAENASAALDLARDLGLEVELQGS